nr:hypothetical protein [Tanacetum cinerariifolium]
MIFFAPGPLPIYAGNPNNNNVWIEADAPLRGELGVVADEPMVGPIVDAIAELIVEAEEQMIAPLVGMDEDIAMLFGDDDFEDDDFGRFDEEEVWEVNEEWLMASVTPPSMPAVPPPSVYEVGGPSTADAEGQTFPLPAPKLPKVIQVSDAEVATGIFIRETGPRVFAIEGQVQDNHRWYVLSKVVLESMTIHLEIWPVDLRLLDCAIREYFGDSEWSSLAGLKLARENLQSGVKKEDSITNVDNTVFDLGVMSKGHNCNASRPSRLCAQARSRSSSSLSDQEARYSLEVAKWAGRAGSGNGPNGRG